MDGIRKKIRKLIIEIKQKSKEPKILYIHGLGSSVKKEKVNKLKGAKIIAPDFNYENGHSSFGSMCGIIERENIQAVVGHSLGGFFAYYLSEKYGIPALLFAPSFDDEDREVEPKPKFTKSKNKNITRIAVLGDDDDVILDKKKQLSELNKDKYQIFNAKMGHDIPIQIKITYFNQFISEI